MKNKYLELFLKLVGTFAIVVLLDLIFFSKEFRLVESLSYAFSIFAVGTIFDYFYDKKKK